MTIHDNIGHCRTIQDYERPDMQKVGNLGTYFLDILEKIWTFFRYKRFLDDLLKIGFYIEKIRLK